MARSINKVTLVGNLAADVESRSMPSGDTVANFTVATSEEWKDKQSGNKQSRTEWNRVVAFRGLADVATKYLKKGAKVYIEGSLQTKKWTKDGQDHYTTEIIASELVMLDAPTQGQQPQAQPQAQPQPQPQPQAQPQPPAYDLADSDIPF